MLCARTLPTAHLTSSYVPKGTQLRKTRLLEMMQRSIRAALHKEGWEHLRSR
jgi:hypothetical protein